MQSWGVFKWDRQNLWWSGRISRDLLNRLIKLIALPAGLEAERQRLNRVQEAVDAERTKPDSEVALPVSVPVKAELYTHQKRAIQMCLLHFGIIEP